MVKDWHIDVVKGQVVAFPGVTRVPPTGEHAVEVDALKAWLAANPQGWDSFTVTAAASRFRGQRVTDSIYAFRRIPPKPASLESLGHSIALVRAAMAPEHATTGGLIFVAGPTGAGKTTTAVSLTTTRAEKYGGYLLAIEDPIEFEIAGFHGENGWCEQIEAQNPSDYAEKVIRAMRCFPAQTPGTLYLGELREEVTAREAIKIGLSGFLVITTLHSHNTIAAIQRVLGMMGGEESVQARSMLANALRLIIFQKWKPDRSAIESEFLPMSDMVRGAIKNGRLDAIKDEQHKIKMQIRNSEGRQ